MDIKKIIKRIKQKTGAKNQKEIATLLNLSESDFSNRKKRETLLIPVIHWAVHENVNVHWLVTGSDSDEENKVFAPVINDVFTKFKDKGRLLEIMTKLVQIEQSNPTAYEKIETYINGVAVGLNAVISG